MNNTGLTLIEVLVSMVILSIVIISFLTFFSQSLLFSTKVEDRLTTVNLAELVLSEIRTQGDFTLDHLDGYKNINGKDAIEINNKLYYIDAGEITELDNPEINELGLVPFYVKVSSNTDFDPSDTTTLLGYRIEED